MIIIGLFPWSHAALESRASLPARWTRPVRYGYCFTLVHQATSVSRCTGRDVHNCIDAQIEIVPFANALASVRALSLKLQHGAARQIRVRGVDGASSSSPPPMVLLLPAKASLTALVLDIACHPASA